MKHAIPYFPAFIVFFMSCVSSSKYQSLASRSEQLQLSNVELKKENDSLQILARELKLTKEQLEKTENVLIEFYQKYEGKSPNGNLTSSPKTENQWDTVQSEMTKLVEENSHLQDNIKKYELELVDLQNQLQEHTNKQSLAKDKNKSVDLLNKQLEESKANQKNLKTELSNKENEFNSLKKDIAKLNLSQTEFHNQSKLNDFLIDSLHSEIQYLNIKNKDLALQISDLNAKFEEEERTNREMQNSDKINLQNELTNLNIKLQSLENQNHSLLDSIKVKNDELTSLQQSFEENKTLLNQQKLKPEDKSAEKKGDDQKAEITKLKSDLKLTEKNLYALNESIDEKNQEIKDLKEQLNGSNEEITSLKKKSNSKDQSKSTEPFGELKPEPTNDSRNEKLIHTIQTEKDSLINNLDKLYIEKEKYALENRQLSEELDSQNKQIEILSLKYSEKSYQDEHSDKLKPLQDSITYLHNETIRMQHVNKSLESEIHRNQSTLATRESIIDSLKSVIRSENTNKLTLDKPSIENPTIDTTNNEPSNISKPGIGKQESLPSDKKLNQLKEEPKKTRKENVVSNKQKLDSLKVSSNRDQKNIILLNGNLPNTLIEKINTFASEHSHSGLLSFKENSAMLIVLPQTFVFNGESIAMTQAGSEIILKLCSLLKSYNTIKIDLTGYSSTDVNGLKTSEISFKRANTIFKLMNVSGINPGNLKLGSEILDEHTNQNLPSARIEIKIHAK